jgi:hypothetical protein
MNITRGHYSAEIDPIHIVGRKHAEYRVVVSRYGMPVYDNCEVELQEAMRVAKAYIDWELDNRTGNRATAYANDG